MTKHEQKYFWPKIRNIVIIISLLYLYRWASMAIDLNVRRIGKGLPLLARIFSAMFPPDWSLVEPALMGAIQSFYIAILGTTLGSLLAIPLGCLASRQVVAHRFLSGLSRFICNAIRTLPELVLAIFFVASYGPGPMAGVMAVAIHSCGVLGKLFADTIDTIDQGSLEALRMTGANSLQIFQFGVVPQVLPNFVATSLYRFESNIRAANTLGLVGAGGIGVLLLQALQFRRWPAVGMALLVIIIVVSSIDYLSTSLRKFLV